MDVLGMFGICSTASEPHGRTESDYARRRKVREGSIEQSKSVIKAIRSGYSSSISYLISVFCKSYFSSCRSLLSISFESGLNLQRIKEFAFSYSRLKTIVIPNDIHCIDRSAFAISSLESLSISPSVSDFYVFGLFLADSFFI
jgi:hypothetical protein